MNKLHISKIDASKRELEHAIRLFFLAGDPVVIHLVVSSSQHILYDLCKNKGIETTLDKMMAMIKEERKEEVRKIFNSTYNFFHHAKKDPEGIMPFNPEANEYALWLSVEMYHSLTDEITGIMMSLKLWFFTKYSDLITKPEDRDTYIKLAKDIDINNKQIFIQIATELENKRTK